MTPKYLNSSTFTTSALCIYIVTPASLSFTHIVCFASTDFPFSSPEHTFTSLVSLRPTLSSHCRSQCCLQTLIFVHSCLTSSFSLSITAANQKTSRANPRCHPNPTLNSKVTPSTYLTPVSLCSTTLRYFTATPEFLLAPYQMLSLDLQKYTVQLLLSFSVFLHQHCHSKHHICGALSQHEAMLLLIDHHLCLTKLHQLFPMAS